MERPTCKTCPYWKQLSETELYGECRHGPAKHGAETQLECDPGTVNIMWGVWFDQHEDEWCGAHPDFAAYIASLKTPESAVPKVQSEAVTTMRDLTIALFELNMQLGLHPL